MFILLFKLVFKKNPYGNIVFVKIKQEITYFGTPKTSGACIKQYTE